MNPGGGTADGRTARAPRLDRRRFLAGAFSTFGYLALSDGIPPGKAPELVFGVVSDSHLRRSRRGEFPAPSFPTEYWRRALEYFRDNDVDAVVHCGDLAHRGLVCEMRFHADVWNRVFPSNRGRTGRRVEKLFVTGNHDWVGSGYCNFGAEMYPDPEIRRTKVLATDMAKNWEAIWHEPYSRSWHKCVKGYHFFGEHFEGAYGRLKDDIPKGAEAYALKGSRPFFVLQHMIPRKNLRDALRKGYPNAMAFFGHWHHSLASEASIVWNGLPMIQCASLRNSVACAVPGFPAIRASERSEEVRQGLLVRVYDDRIVIHRRDFVNGGSLGPDWVLPLGRYAPHPFSRPELVRTVGAPEFPAGARLGVKRTEAGLTVAIPAATARAAARAYAYDLVAVGTADRVRLHRCVYAAGCDLAADHALARGPTEVTIRAEELPKGGELTLAVRPVSALGRAGRAIGCEERSYGFPQKGASASRMTARASSAD